MGKYGLIVGVLVVSGWLMFSGFSEPTVNGEGINWADEPIMNSVVNWADIGPRV